MTDTAPIVALLRQADPRTREDLIALSLLELAAADQTLALAPALLAVVQRFLDRTGIGSGVDAAAIWTEVESYLAINPIDPQLLLAVRQELRRALVERDPGVDAALGFLGIDKAPPPGDAVPPEGSIPADPFARFRLAKQSDK